MIGLSSRSQMSLSSLIIQGHLTSKRQQPHSEPKSWSPAKGRFGRLRREHPETARTIAETDIHANHAEAFWSALRRKCATFRRKTNTQQSCSQFQVYTFRDVGWL